MWPQGCFKLEFSHAGLTDNRDARGGSWEEVSCAFTKECGRVAFTTIKTARFADTSEFLGAKNYFKKCTGHVLLSQRWMKLRVLSEER